MTEGPTSSAAIEAIHEDVSEALKCIVDELSMMLGKDLGVAVNVCLGVCQDARSLTSDPAFILHMNRSRGNLTETEYLSQLAFQASAGQLCRETLFEGPVAVPVVSTRIRSAGVSPRRRATSLPFWVIKHSPAHAHFKGQDPENDGGVYCPGYDLHVEKADALKNGNGSSFKCPRREWWEHYRSVAIFPIRARASNNGDMLIGFLWLDSGPPRVFRDCFERPGRRNDWSAEMHYMHAVCDTIGLLLSLESYLCDHTPAGVAPSASPFGKGVPPVGPVKPAPPKPNEPRADDKPASTQE